jgi:NADPH:quinone reductase-like Zn-dependent oxidoreductase
MQAILSDRYGPPDVLELREVERPEPAPGRVLVRVCAASLNAGDWRVLSGTPRLARPMMGGIRRPKEPRRGGDVAGVVEAVSAEVTELAPGDDVFGSGLGSFAEYVAPLATNLVRKPAWLSFEEAAAIPVAGVTALQALRDHGRLEAGQSVLINGAGGGVGTFLVQIAKALGGDVTAVCGPGSVEVVRASGADRVVDYSREDFTDNPAPYDLVVDNAGTRSVRRMRRLLTPQGTYVVVGSVKNPLGHMAAAVVQRPFTKQRLATFIAKINGDDLAHLAALADSGALRPAIERTYALADTADAYRHMVAGHVRGKLVIVPAQSSSAIDAAARAAPCESTGR